MAFMDWVTGSLGLRGMFTRTDAVDPLLEQRKATEKQLRQVIQFLTDENIETDQKFEERLRVLDERLVRGYPESGLAYDQRLYDHAKWLVEQHQREIAGYDDESESEVLNFSLSSDSDVVERALYREPDLEYEQRGICRKVWTFHDCQQHMKVAVKSLVAHQDTESLKQLLHTTWTCSIRYPPATKVKNLEGSRDDELRLLYILHVPQDVKAKMKITRAEAVRSLRGLLASQNLDPYAQNYADRTAQQAQTSTTSRPTASMKSRKVPVPPHTPSATSAMAAPATKVIDKTRTGPFWQPRPQKPTPIAPRSSRLKKASESRTRQWAYGGPDNETEIWHADMPASLPFGETIEMAQWESDKIIYDLAQSSREKAEEDDNTITETHVPFNPKKAKSRPWYESGSRFYLPAADEHLREILRSAPGCNMIEVMTDFNDVTADEISEKAYVPRKTLPQFLSVAHYPEGEGSPISTSLTSSMLAQVLPDLDEDDFEDHLPDTPTPVPPMQATPGDLQRLTPMHVSYDTPRGTLGPGIEEHIRRTLPGAKYQIIRETRVRDPIPMRTTPSKTSITPPPRAPETTPRSSSSRKTRRVIDPRFTVRRDELPPSPDSPVYRRTRGAEKRKASEEPEHNRSVKKSKAKKKVAFEDRRYVDDGTVESMTPVEPTTAKARSGKRGGRERRK